MTAVRFPTPLAAATVAIKKYGGWILAAVMFSWSSISTKFVGGVATRWRIMLDRGAPFNVDFGHKYHCLGFVGLKFR